MDLEHLKEWIGRTETTTDVATVSPVARLAATLDAPETQWSRGDALPPLWHWLYFLPDAAQAELGIDGHPARGGFLPPVPLPRRMFAGGRLSYPGTIRLGDELNRVSRVETVELKEGRQGPLVFVTVRHDINAGGELAVVEEQDLVYIDRRPSSTDGPREAQPAPDTPWRLRVEPTPALLFRYSALTFNAHRIHYDRDYVTVEEGYPGLVVQGPLLATLMAELARRNSTRETATFSFRSHRPLFESETALVLGTPTPHSVDVAVYNDRGVAVATSAISMKSPAINTGYQG